MIIIQSESANLLTTMCSSDWDIEDSDPCYFDPEINTNCGCDYQDA